MRKLVAALILLLIAMPAAGQQTVNTWERGYITAAVPAEISPADSVDITPPIIESDTLNVRGFMVGISGAAVHTDHSVFMRYREAGDDGWERWDQWLKCRLNYGMPLVSEWKYGAGIKSANMTPFIPISNVRLLRLFNHNNTSATTVTIWFIDKQDADEADWSKWDLPNEYK